MTPLADQTGAKIELKKQLCSLWWSIKDVKITFSDELEGNTMEIRRLLDEVD
jgi:hypothetical protein